MEKLQEKLYTPKEVSHITGVEADLLRKWCEAFNIVTEWTKPNNQGHRRFTKRNIEEILAVKKKIHEQNWSWDQVRSWRNGEVDSFVSQEEKSNLDKKMDVLLSEMEVLRSKSEQQEQFNIALVQQLEKMSSQIEKTILENRELKQYIRDQLPSRIEIEERDKALMQSLNESLEEKRIAAAKEEEEKGFFSRLFGIGKSKGKG